MTFFKDFERRCEEIDKLLNWLGAPLDPDDTDLTGGLESVEIEPTLKASVFLMLYNLVEGTAAAAILGITDAIEASSEPFMDFSREMQLLTLRNIHIDGSSDKWHGESVANRGGGDIVRMAVTKRQNYFSGNLDLVEILKLFSKFGISLDDPTYFEKEIGRSFKTVLSKRNVLAHGEASFSNVGRNATIIELRSIFENIKKGLTEVVTSIDKFISSRGFIESGEATSGSQNDLPIGQS